MKLPNSNEVRKPSKTLAGVTPIAVMCKPRKCRHGTCLYCPSLNVPQSYTPLSPPVIRAKMLNYSAYEQVKSRLKAFKLMNHPTDKIELIIMGGTFLSYPKSYQYKFVKDCYDALNFGISGESGDSESARKSKDFRHNKKSRNLEHAKKINELARHRCIALCIETRPDFCNKKEIKRMLEFGATRVELGVQCLDNNIYKKINRGHKVEDVIKATKLLKDSCFKVGYHIMPGLPFSSIKKDFKMFKKIFADDRFKPDQLKIYPCQVIKGSKLERLYNQGKYKPYTKEQTEKLLIEIMKIVPEYCRVMRIMREIPPAYLVAGTTRIDLRKDIEAEIKSRKIKIKETRFREIGFNLRDLKKGQRINQNLKLKIIKYKASKGEEYFLQVVNKQNILFGLLRLRLACKPFLQELKNAAIIRELHVYGKSLKIGEKAKFLGQHSGLGKMLMKKAEEIAEKERKIGKIKINKIAVIAGAGVREYYRKLKYKLEGSYMVKDC